MKEIFREKGILAGIVFITILLFFSCWGNFVIVTPDLHKVKDGSYIGEYRSGPVRVKANVLVKNGAITEVKILEHINGRGGKAEAITDSIIEEQSLGVDAISGATLSSKVILKAVEIALSQGLN
jgi:uncharacterized protein with FMN-binding domain